MHRRKFLEDCGYGLASLLAAQTGTAHARTKQTRSGPEIGADIVIVGGGLGGCAAALAALRAGRTVVLTEPTDWIGGQLTSQAVPPDEHPWIEQFGANASYGRSGRDPRLLSPPLPHDRRGAGEPRYFNPGNGGVSKLCHEPRVALAVLTDMLAPYCLERPAADACSSTSRSAPTCRAIAFGRSRSATAGPVASDRWSPRIFSTRPSWAICCRWPASSS